MLKICKDAWFENKDKLEDAIREDKNINKCDYPYLVGLVLEYILNPFLRGKSFGLNTDAVTVVDNGNYRGTLLFIIPFDTYEPSEQEYMITYCCYGGCSCCDTLQSIRDFGSNELPTENQVRDYMILCLDLVRNMVSSPYNYEYGVFAKTVRWEDQE